VGKDKSNVSNLKGLMMGKKEFEERNRVFDNYSDGLTLLARNGLRDRTKAGEVVQEARELFVLSKEEIKNPAAWLYIVVRNLVSARKKIDSKTISLERIPDLESKLLNPLEYLLDRETKERVRKAVSELPDIYRDAVKLYYDDGRSAEEAANLLGIKKMTFLSRLDRARMYLFGLLGGDDFLH
jgi:RNA polymerase sigma-70 factor (ECF subfamily)